MQLQAIKETVVGEPQPLSSLSSVIDKGLISKVNCQLHVNHVMLQVHIFSL